MRVFKCQRASTGYPGRLEHHQRDPQLSATWGSAGVGTSPDAHPDPSDGTVCDVMQAELDQHRNERAINGGYRAYYDGSGGYAPRYCGEVPPTRRCRYDNGFNDGGGFSVWPLIQRLRPSLDRPRFRSVLYFSSVPSLLLH